MPLISNLQSTLQPLLNPQQISCWWLPVRRKEPEEILPHQQTSWAAAALPCFILFYFFAPRQPAAQAASSTIGQSPSVAHPPPSAAPHQLSDFLRDDQDEATMKRIFFFLRGVGGNQTNLTGVQGSPAFPSPSCCSQGWMKRLQRRSGEVGGWNRTRSGSTLNWIWAPGTAGWTCSHLRVKGGKGKNKIKMI